MTSQDRRHKRIANIVLINANVRVCGNCGLAEPDAPCKCTEGASHNWNY